MRMTFTAGETATLTGRQPDAAKRSFVVHDEQFTLLDDSRRPLANIRYRIVTDAGQIFTGTTDTAGQTHRIATDASATLKIYTMEH